MNQKNRESVTQKFEFRNIRPEETDQAVMIEQICFPPNEACSEAHMRERIEKAPELFLVAEENGQVAGYAGLLRVMDEGDVTNVVVDEAYRGKGLGTRLMAALLEEGRGCGMKEFTLEVRVSNQRAIRLYESLGFVQEGIRKRFYERPVEDALIMWKRDQGATSNLLFR